MLAITGGSQPDWTPTLTWKAYQSKNVSPDSLCEALRLHNDATEVVLLDSQGHKGERGTFSILGLVHPQETLKVTYRVDDRRIRWGTSPDVSDLCELQLDSIDQVWPVLQKVLDAHNPRGHGITTQDLPTEIPFYGGFAGYISYEAGLETIQVASDRPSEIPDINFAFIQRSIVINHEQVRNLRWSLGKISPKIRFARAWHTFSLSIVTMRLGLQKQAGPSNSLRSAIKSQPKRTRYCNRP